MPVAGQEGYNTLVICPFDKSHEIILGRLQFHVSQCCKNFPNKKRVKCPFNSIHNIPSMEIEFHIQVCNSRDSWYRAYCDVGKNDCPVKDLVPVNAATVPDADESWDDFQAPSSVLDSIKVLATEKNILRHLQCESKSERKAFRKAEQDRHRELEKKASSTTPSTSSSVASSSGQLCKPQQTSTVPIKRQDPASAVKTLDMGTKNMNLNSSSKNYTLQNNSSSTTSYGASCKDLSSNKSNSVSVFQKPVFVKSPSHNSNLPLFVKDQSQCSNSPVFVKDQSHNSNVIGTWPTLSGKSSVGKSACTQATRSYAGTLGARSATATTTSSTSNSPSNPGRQVTSSSVEVPANRKNYEFSHITTPGRGRGFSGLGQNRQMSRKY